MRIAQSLVCVVDSLPGRVSFTGRDRPLLGGDARAVGRGVGLYAAAIRTLAGLLGLGPGSGLLRHCLGVGVVAGGLGGPERAPPGPPGRPGAARTPSVQTVLQLRAGEPSGRDRRAAPWPGPLRLGGVGLRSRVLCDRERQLAPLHPLVLRQCLRLDGPLVAGGGPSPSTSACFVRRASCASRAAASLMWRSADVCSVSARCSSIARAAPSASARWERLCSRSAATRAASASARSAAASASAASRLVADSAASAARCSASALAGPARHRASAGRRPRYRRAPRRSRRGYLHRSHRSCPC